MLLEVNRRFQEIWVEVDGASICALINGDLGWLMFLPASGEPGFSSRNPAYDGPGDSTIEYRLENGQLDVYPSSWAYPIDEVRRALDYFRDEKKRPPFIDWHAD
jgi:hypothetical protein